MTYSKFIDLLKNAKNNEKYNYMRKLSKNASSLIMEKFAIHIYQLKTNKSGIVL